MKPRKEGNLGIMTKIKLGIFELWWWRFAAHAYGEKVVTKENGIRERGCELVNS